ncbi:hypothetical protein SAMN04488034_11910 [Salinimicrobium catena]|uniref:Uncharacterized protein n=1 Tax=Salinimicrobium catena TaxID=390640 RepID=A0A1H5PJX0_9FLAO|nr:hypothetical protein SAMN04488140_12010 [Salinimicrobium catena]SEF13371.1 hypothetical protein SAMN04488034_11910 [Salinimicrobium catena]
MRKANTVFSSSLEWKTKNEYISGSNEAWRLTVLTLRGAVGYNFSQKCTIQNTLE